MKLHIHVAGVDETVEVRDADEALKRTREEAARRAPFLARPIIKAMNDQTFAAEAVKRHNAEKGLSDPIPSTAQQFLDWAIQRGYVSVVE
jgi:hypothetical protein